MKGTKQDKGIGPIARGMMAALNHLPYVDRWHPWMRPDKTDMRWLPINEDIRTDGDMPMPIAVLDRIIEEASHRVIIDFCGCRRGFKCRDYPTDIGCLLMGDSAMEQRKYPCREVTVEEAKAHSRRAVDAGLVPTIGKARVDNFIFDIKDRSRMVTVCYCCECCCITRYTSFLPAGRLDASQPHLEGVSITVTDRCKGCGKCAEKCYIGAIDIVNGRAVIGPKCRACGRCAAECAQDAIEVSMSDPEFVEKTIERIRSYVNWSQT